jgi:hypothetical protein
LISRRPPWARRRGKGWRLASATATRFTRPLDPKRRCPRGRTPRPPRKGRRGPPRNRSRASVGVAEDEVVGECIVVRRAGSSICSFVRSRGESGSDRCDGRSEPLPIGDESMDRPRRKARGRYWSAGMRAIWIDSAGCLGDRRIIVPSTPERWDGNPSQSDGGHEDTSPTCKGEARSIGTRAEAMGKVAAPQLHLRVRHLDGSSRSSRAPRFRSRR